MRYNRKVNTVLASHAEKVEAKELKKKKKL